ncbi:hypothetical protein T08_6589 [Trichinella sp. T8]|nr:hypothetical protein T08_6589 [Trichinella sp. T8]
MNQSLLFSKTGINCSFLRLTGRIIGLVTEQESCFSRIDVQISSAKDMKCRNIWQAKMTFCSKNPPNYQKEILQKIGNNEHKQKWHVNCSNGKSRCGDVGSDEFEKFFRNSIFVAIENFSV